MSNFKIGDKVKYVSKKHGDYSNNPLWGGRFGKVEGIIERIGNFPHECNIEVMWDNLRSNSYYISDLELVGGKGHPLTTIFKDEKDS